MAKYKITVDEICRNDDEYDRYKTIYEQTVTGDYSIVNGVVKTVLDYNTTQEKEPVIVEGLSA